MPFSLFFLFSSIIQQIFSKYLLGVIMFYLLNQGTPEIALHSSHAHTIKEPSFELLTPRNINLQYKDSPCRSHIQSFPKRVPGLLYWSLSHRQCHCGVEWFQAIVQAVGQPRSDYFGQMLIPGQTTMCGISQGMSHESYSQMEVWNILGVLRMRQYNWRATFQCIQDQRQMLMLLLHISLTYHHFLSFSLLMSGYISTNSPFNCKLLFCHLIFNFPILTFY